MTIKGLFKYIERSCPDAIKSLSLDQLKGKHIAIDLPIFMHRGYHSSKHLPLDQAIGAFWDRFQQLLDANVIFTFVTDGARRELKQETKEKRIKAMEATKQRESLRAENLNRAVSEEDSSSLIHLLDDDQTLLKRLLRRETAVYDALSPIIIGDPDHAEEDNGTEGTEEDAKNAVEAITSGNLDRELSNAQIFEVPKKITDIIAEAVTTAGGTTVLDAQFTYEEFSSAAYAFIEGKGYTINVAEFDAEERCCELVYAKKADWVFSVDGDVIAYGCSLFRPDGRNFQFINYNVLLETSGFTKDQFTDLCVMCGTDFCDNIRGIGPVKSYKLLQKHGTLQEVLNQTIKDLTDDQRDRMLEVREIFDGPKKVSPLPDSSK